MYSHNTRIPCVKAIASGLTVEPEHSPRAESIFGWFTHRVVLVLLKIFRNILCRRFDLGTAQRAFSYIGNNNYFCLAIGSNLFPFVVDNCDSFSISTVVSFFDVLCCPKNEDLFKSFCGCSNQMYSC